MPLLAALAGSSLDRGDILRLAEDYDRGPGSGPVDLLVFDPREDGFGLGLMVASGYKAGLVLHVLPPESRHSDGGIAVDWLLANWDAWFVFTYSPARLPVETARVLRKDGRSLPEEA